VSNSFDESLRGVIRAIVREELARCDDQRQPSDPYLPTAEAAVVAGVAEGTIRRWVREARIPGHRAGRELRVRMSDLQRLLASGVRPMKHALSPSPEELARRHFGLQEG
jgi:excisionase family DNA binding protein